MTATISCRTLDGKTEGEKQGKAHNKESEPHNTDDQMSHSTEYTVPLEPKPASKKQHRDSLQPTTKRAPKTTAKKKVQFRQIEVEESVSANTGFSVIKT